MLTNYLKIAFRNLQKYRLNSAINIAGLAVGLTCFLFIFLYVKEESSFDAYHSHVERLYRLNFFAKLGDQVANTAASPKPAGPTFKDEVPEIEAFCRLQWRENVALRFDNQVFNEETLLLADSSLFQVFSFKLLEGDPRKVLAAPNSVVLSRSLAEKYFGSESPVGKPLQIKDLRCQVTGLMEDLPQNTHFRTHLFLSMNSEAERDNADWGNTSTYNYFLLRKGADPKTTSEKASAVFIKNFSPILKSAFDSSWEDFVKAGNYARVELFPLRDIHLHSDLEDELGTNGDIKHVYIFGIIGLFILALACINFMNLATARAAIRAREVGVRKAVGAMRTDLAKQFLSESVLMSLAALGLALAAVWLLLPMFNQLSGKELTISIFITPGFWLAALALAVLIGVAAGSYPAFFLSAFQPGRVLKGGATASSFSGAGNRNLRSALVVFQFSTTSVLLIGSLVVYQQLEFIRNKKLGFNRENVFILNNAYQLGGQLNSFKEKVLQSPAVQRATYCNSLPALSLSNSNVVYKGRQATQENSVLANNWWADHDYLKTLDMAIVAGRDFSKTLASDSTAVIVNETFAKSFGYPQKSALDGEISLTIDDEGNLETRHIVGVVKDFNFSSLRNTIEPLAIYQSQRAGYLAVRFQTEKVDVLVKNMRSAWDEMAPGKPFDYAFLDQRFDKLYATESRMEKIVKVFACLAIFIACIGLFGLSTFMTEQRRKEIGIRKVLGASVAGITALLAKDFLKLVLIAIVIASPVAYWFMQKWLADFAYRIDLQWWIFAVAGAMAVAVAFLTVSFQSVRAALANPVKSLRSE